MPSLFFLTKSVKTWLLVITSLFVVAYSCGIGEYRSIVNDGCAPCPDNATGCDTHKPLYMEDYQNCMNCNSFTTTIHTDEVIMGVCSKHEYLSLEGCEGCPKTPEGCNTHKPLYMKIFKRCMECDFTETTSSTSPSVNIWAIIGALAGCILFGLFFAKFILPLLMKRYKGRARHRITRRGSDERHAEQILIHLNISENAVEHNDQSDNADSNPAPANSHPAPLHLNTEEQVEDLNKVNDENTL